MKRRRLPPKRGATPRRGKTARARQADKEMLDLVRSGVEQFILERATVADFLKTLRQLSEKENIYAHQLTSSVFTKIVKAAIKKRTINK